jgi:hypothetical protein
MKESGTLRQSKSNLSRIFWTKEPFQCDPKKQISNYSGLLREGLAKGMDYCPDNSRRRHLGQN